MANLDLCLNTQTGYLIIIILGALSTSSARPAIDMYLPAFPEMAAAPHTSTARISLSLASYFAGLAAGQLFYGPLLDRFGRKLPLYAGLILFIAAPCSACVHEPWNGSSPCALCRQWADAPRRLPPWPWCGIFSRRAKSAKNHLAADFDFVSAPRRCSPPASGFLWPFISAGSGCSSSCPSSWP